MPTINITGATADSASAKSNLVDKFNKDPNYVSGAESLIRRSARETLQKQSRWDAMVETAERQNYQWDKVFESKRRAQDERELRLDAQAGTRARRQKETAERQQIRRKETLIDRINRNLIRDEDRRSAQAYKFMRSEADYMNREFNRKRNETAYGRMTGAGGFGGHGFGYGPQTNTGRIAHGVSKYAMRAASFDSLGGMAAGAGGLALAALGATWEAPALYSKLLGGAVSGASPFYNLTSSAARMARGGGGSSAADFMGSVFTGRKPPSWTSRYGWDPQGALDIAGRTGIPIGSTDALRSIDSSIGAASTSLGLGSLGTDGIAGMLGLFNKVSGSRNNPNADGNWGFRGTGMGQGNDFLRRWGGVTAKAMTLGIDASTVASTLGNVLNGMAASGAANINTGNATSFIGQMLSGGNASMRTGAGITSAASAASTFADSAGAGGSSIRTMATITEARKRNKGKLPKTMAELGRVFHFDPSNLSPSDKLQAQRALQAARAGDQWAFSTLVAPFAGQDPSFALDASTDFVGSLGVPGYDQQILSSALFGGDTSAKSQSYITSWETGKNAKLHDGSLGWSDISPDQRAMVEANAKRTGLDSAVIAGMIQQESSWDPRAKAKGSSALGMTQMTRGALDQLHRLGVDTDISYKQLTDPSKSIRAGSDYLSYLTRKEGGSVGMGLAAYKGGLGNPDLRYASQVESSSISFSPNPEARQNQAKAELGQAQMVASFQSSREAQVLSTGPVAASFEAADGAAKALADGLAQLNAVVGRVVRSMQGGSANPGSPMRHAPMQP